MGEQAEYVGAVDLGLEGVVACSTAISTIAGTTLLYRGYTIEDLAEHAGFEEVAYLLWHGRLPGRAELEALRGQLGASVALPPEARIWLLGLPKRVHPMDFLHAVVAGLSLHDPDANVLSPEANLRKSIRLTARIGTIVAAYHRARAGLWPIEPVADRSLAWNFLYALDGEEPSAQRVLDFDVCLVLHADHELNASTFSARVTSSSLSGIYSSVMAAIGTLKGPLHGGANEEVIRMLREIGSVARVDHYLEQALSEGRKVMGFGHRVYKAGDPRAKVLKRMSARLTAEAGTAELYAISELLERRMSERKGLIPNVDFYSATVYDALGIPRDLFTSVFAMSRVAGWCAHVLEQYANNRIYRPRGRYVGATGLRYVPLDER